MMTKYTRFRDVPKFTPSGSYAVDYPLDSLAGWVTEKERDSGLLLYPDFQRGHVWSEKQQIAFVEFLLRGGKTGRDLYFNCPSWEYQVEQGAYNEFVCVDGLQRITAIRRFIRSEIPVFGSYYREYTDSLRDSTDTMRVHINDLKSRREVLQWYIDLNAGGTPHSDAEIDRVRYLLEEENMTLLYYEAGLEVPDVLGHDDQYFSVVRTRDLEEAKAALAKGRNYLTRTRRRANGSLHTDTWDPIYGCFSDDRKKENLV